MGGVDLFDMLMALYKVDHKSRKWYHRIFFWSFNVAMMNGWLLYKRHCQQKGIPMSDLLKFTTTVSQSLIMDNKVPQGLSLAKRRGRPSRSKAAVTEGPSTSAQDAETTERPMKKARRVLLVNETCRFDMVGHLPGHCETKQRCKLCGQYVRLKCFKCDCHLCVTKYRNCFVKYHTKERRFN
jgi:hypothetical protein